MTLAVGTVASAKIFMVQQQLVLISKQDAWISMLLGSILTQLSAMNIYYLSILNPGKDLPQIYLQNFGKVLGRFLLIGGIIYIFTYICVITKVFTEVVKTFLLTETPATFISVLLILTIITVVRKGVESITKMSNIIAPFFLITLFLIIILSAKEANIANIKPILYKNTLNVLKGAIPAYASFLGHTFISFLLLYTPEPKKTFKWYMIGIAIPMFIYTLLTFMTMLVFDPTEVETMMYPTLSLSKSIEFPITLLERLEILMIIIWIPAMFIAISTYLYANIRSIVVFFNLKEKHHTYLAYLYLIPIVLTFYVTQDSIQTIDYINTIEIFGTIQVGVMLPIITLISLIRNKKEKKKQKQNISP